MFEQDILDLKEAIARIEGKVDLMTVSLTNCQKRCHVDNPPRGWRRLFGSMTMLASVIF
jgi:hypothetical protein